MARTDVAVPGNQSARLDEIDRAILGCLRTDARMTNRALADAVGLSPAPCLRRVRRLERDGVIRGYSAILGGAAMPAMVAFVGVRLARHEQRVTREFERKVQALKGVAAVFHVTGGYDYFLRVEVNDVSEYRQLHTAGLGSLNGVAHVTTFVVISEIGSGADPT